MHDWDNFKTFKERGELVELLFMAAAASHGYHVLKPWGDSFEYDVGVESRAGMLRVQVKSSTARNGTGYLCQFRRNYQVKEPYSIDEVDLFAIYVIPEAVWYLIPASVILTPPRKVAVTLCPVTARRKDRYRYEQYREAWQLLAKSPRELSKFKRWDPNATKKKPIPRPRNRALQHSVIPSEELAPRVPHFWPVLPEVGIFGWNRIPHLGKENPLLDRNH